MNLDHSASRDAESSARDPRTTESSTPFRSARLASLGLVGSSRPMQRLREEVARYARSTASVLVHGESGVGKEKVAEALHAASDRAQNPFVIIDCAALSENLLEAELFGHTKGAFTGAASARAGAFETAADGGTVFLDEIGEMPLSMQPKLLRVLESHTVRRVGECNYRRVNVRVIAATNRDLAQMVRERSFREDLYFRLAVLLVSIPPLRERRDDLPELVEHLLRQLRPEVGMRRMTPDALALLAQHEWRGNVRELGNVLRRVTARTDAPMLGTTEVYDALSIQPGKHASVPYELPARSALSASMVADALHACNGSVAGAARRLGVARTTLRDHLRARVLAPTPPPT